MHSFSVKTCAKTEPASILRLVFFFALLCSVLLLLHFFFFISYFFWVQRSEWKAFWKLTFSNSIILKCEQTKCEKWYTYKSIQNNKAHTHTIRHGCIYLFIYQRCIFYSTSSKFTCETVLSYFRNKLVCFFLLPVETLFAITKWEERKKKK